MRLVVAAVLYASTAPLPAQARHIEDNSFLIEEAYNQEPHVVQHISNWQRSLNTSTWNFSFTQEWPVATQRHQLSYSFLLGWVGQTGTEFGGLQLNYRYQLTPARGRVAIAPRISTILPAHRDHEGVQVEVPVSVRLSSSFVTHWNAGVMETTRATTLYNLGGSVIWLAGPTFNVLCEATWSKEQGAEVLLVNPGVRWAYNFESGLQICPGWRIPSGWGRRRAWTGPSCISVLSTRLAARRNRISPRCKLVSSSN